VNRVTRTVTRVSDSDTVTVTDRHSGPGLRLPGRTMTVSIYGQVGAKSSGPQSSPWHWQSLTGKYAPRGETQAIQSENSLRKLKDFNTWHSAVDFLPASDSDGEHFSSGPLV
jgi:hypothetical protein